MIRAGLRRYSIVDFQYANDYPAALLNSSPFILPSSEDQLQIPTGRGAAARAVMAGWGLEAKTVGCSERTQS